MANVRPGISFYRTDSGHIRDPKIRLLRNEYGNDGYFIYKALEDKAHEEWGYYFDMNDEEEFELFADDLKMKTTLVREVISGCLRRGLFDQAVAEMSKVLTNAKMQEVFVYATAERRRKGSQFEINGEWLLVTFEEIPKNILIVHGKIETIHGKTSQTKQKLKPKLKLKQEGNKNNSSEAAPGAPSDPQNFPSINNEEPKGQDARPKKIVFVPPSHEDAVKWFTDKYDSKSPGGWYPDKWKSVGNEFYDHYTANGWVQGKDSKKIKNWEAAARLWLGRERKGTFSNSSQPQKITQVVLPPPTASIPKTGLSPAQMTINFLYENFTADNDSVTVISVEYSMYDEMQRAGKIDLSEEEKQQIHKNAELHYAAKSVSYDNKILVNLKKRMGVLAMFKKFQHDDKELIFEEK